MIQMTMQTWADRRGTGSHEAGGFIGRETLPGTVLAV